MHVLVGILLCVAGTLCGATCPDEWVAFQGSCYLFPYNHTSDFSDAEFYCNQHWTSHLVHIETASENNFVKGMLRRQKAEAHWLGLTDESTVGEYKWYGTQTSATFTDWHTGQPDNILHANHTENCVEIYPYSDDYFWNDAPCDELKEPICEMSYLNGTCGQGYTGATCDTEIDHCLVNPCHNGTCSNSFQGFSCTCYQGYTGSTCDTVIAPCDDQYGTFYCTIQNQHACDDPVVALVACAKTCNACGTGIH